MDQQSWITLVTGLIAGLGIGSVVTAMIQHSLKIKEVAYQSQREDLESRYRVIILLMYAAYDFSENEATMRIHRPDLKNRDDVLDELRAEWINMMLFASKTTIDALHVFISDPSFDNLVKCAMFMRSDLGRDVINFDKLLFNSSKEGFNNEHG